MHQTMGVFLILIKQHDSTVAALQVIITNAIDKAIHIKVCAKAYKQEFADHFSLKNKPRIAVIILF